MFDSSERLIFAVHGGADSGDGLVGGLMGLLALVESLLQRSPSESFTALMPGLAALPNPHPLFVHFPIALLSVFFVLDWAGALASRPAWRHVASWFLYLGTLFAAVTVAAGLMAAASVAHGDNVHEIMERHEHLGISVLSLSALLSVWRLLARGSLVGFANRLYLSLGAVLGGLLVFTADLGGLMVYRYGVAVVAADQANQAAAHQHQHGASGSAAPLEEIQAANPEIGSAQPDAAPSVEAPPASESAGHDHHHNHNHHHSH